MLLCDEQRNIFMVKGKSTEEGKKIKLNESSREDNQEKQGEEKVQIAYVW